MFIQLFMESFHHFAAAFLIERRNIEANNLSIIIGVDTQIRFLNCLFNIVKQSPFILLNDYQARLWNGNLSNLVDRTWCPVVYNLDSLIQGINVATSTSSR